MAQVCNAVEFFTQPNVQKCLLILKLQPRVNRIDEMGFFSKVRDNRKI